MERETVRRRMNTISAHFVTGIVSDDIAAATTHLFPLNCSSNLSSPFTRLDSRVYFGRQASTAQGYFMRQAATTNEQGNPTQQSELHAANCIDDEDRCVAPAPPSFSRPATVEPLFSRPAPVEFNCSSDGIVEGAKQSEILPSTEYPKFARPGGTTSEGKQLSSCRERVSPHIKGTEWSPRINVVESKSSHVITVELPGVDISDIRVEMDENNIIVRGNRSMKWSKAARYSNESFSTYHRMEISQGPYQVVWPIPAGADKDSVSAELVEGMLQITVPKL